MKTTVALLFSVVLLFSCSKEKENRKPVPKQGTYGFDVNFLKRHTGKLIELSTDTLSKIIVSADYQGRVMTSTATGDYGSSFGWINYQLLQSGRIEKQFNPVGGEERFWLGPEGGQYSIYFAPKSAFSISNWQVPAIIDTVTFDVLRSDSTEAVFAKDASVTNYSGQVFDVGIERSVKILDRGTVEAELKSSIPSSVKMVGYETVNKLTNKGQSDWTKANGVLSIWLLGMMTPTSKTIAIVPFKPTKDAYKYINTSYFGDIPAERLVIKDSVLYFVCDGDYRSKIGLPPSIAKPVAGSYDFKKNVLTIISFPVDASASYVNSKWEVQADPYRGDVINSYNDGKLPNGTRLGPFYELESSSPALELKKGDSGTYRQVTCHFEGDLASLNEISRNVLGVDLNSVR